MGNDIDCLIDSPHITPVLGYSCHFTSGVHSRYLIQQNSKYIFLILKKKRKKHWDALGFSPAPCGAGSQHTCYPKDPSIKGRMTLSPQLRVPEHLLLSDMLLKPLKNQMSANLLLLKASLWRILCGLVAEVTAQRLSWCCCQVWCGE